MARSLEEMRAHAEGCLRMNPQLSWPADVLELVGVVEERERELASLRDALESALDLVNSALTNLNAAQDERTNGLTASAKFIDDRVDSAVLYLDRALLRVSEGHASPAAVSSEGVDG